MESIKNNSDPDLVKIKMFPVKLPSSIRHEIISRFCESLSFNTTLREVKLSIIPKIDGKLVTQLFASLGKLENFIYL